MLCIKKAVCILLNFPGIRLILNIKNKNVSELSCYFSCLLA